MADGNRAVYLFMAVVLVTLVALAVGMYLVPGDAGPGVVAATRPAATGPSSVPATAPADTQVVADYMALVLAKDPDFPTTRPLSTLVELRDAARVVIDQPVYFDRRRLDLWITHPDAPPTAAALAKAGENQVHLLPDRVTFAHWRGNDAGQWFAHLVVRDDDGYALVNPVGRRVALPAREYDWERATSWNDVIVAPTDRGVSLLTVGRGGVTESYQEVVGSEDGPGRVLYALDWRGLLAWAPPDEGQAPSRGAWRYVEGRWVHLSPEAGWPDRILHLTPLLDGSVMALAADGDGGGDEVALRVMPLDVGEVDVDRLDALVNQLSDPVDANREAAYEELTRFGPGAWPHLEGRLPELDPESRVRVRQLMRSRLEPTLGSMVILGDRLRLASRDLDGGAVYYAPSGVQVPDGAGGWRVVNPAWVSMRPGQAPRLMPPQLVSQLDPARVTLTPFQAEWVVAHPVLGPSRFIGNELVPLLPEEQRRFDEFVGIDRRGRWLFRPRVVAPATVPTTAPATRPTLVLDRTLPDPTPRLPVWVIEVAEGSVGWDQDGWPVTKSGGAYALREAEWVPLDDQEDVYYTSVEQMAAPAATRGSDDLDLESILGDLPPTAAGSLERPWVVRTPEGRLFVFNEPGRVLRLGKAKGEPGRYRLEATFAHNVPNVAVERMWVDPAGRLVMAWGGNRLAIAFPEGRIPREIATIMPADALERAWPRSR